MGYKWDNQEERNPPRKVGQEVNESQEPFLSLPQSGLLSHCNSFVFHLTPSSWVGRWKTWDKVGGEMGIPNVVCDLENIFNIEIVKAKTC